MVHTLLNGQLHNPCCAVMQTDRGRFPNPSSKSQCRPSPGKREQWPSSMPLQLSGGRPGCCGVWRRAGAGARTRPACPQASPRRSAESGAAHPPSPLRAPERSALSWHSMGLPSINLAQIGLRLAPAPAPAPALKPGGGQVQGLEGAQHARRGGLERAQHILHPTCARQIAQLRLSMSTWGQG